MSFNDIKIDRNNALQGDITGWTKIDCDTLSPIDYIKSLMKNEDKPYRDKCVSKVHINTGTIVYKPATTAFSNPQYIKAENVDILYTLPKTMRRPFVITEHTKPQYYVYETYGQAYDSCL